jgi:hypothetical protein
MFKKLQVPIFITVFLICLLTGFAVTPRLWPNLPEATPTPGEAADCFEEQCNFVIIHVDNLDKPAPALVAVWTALVSAGSPPTMVLKPLHPSSEQAADNILLSSAFNLSPSGSLAPEFFQALDNLNFDQRGYIMIDNWAASALLSELTNNSISPDSLITSGSAADILSQQSSLLKQVCTHMTANPKSTNANPDWSSLVSAHLRTNLNFGAFVVNWERISLSGPLTHCEVLP